MKQDGIYAGQKVFTGTTWLYDFSVVVKDGFIVELLPTHQINEKPTQEYHTLIPAFIDVQIYGAANRLFSVYPDTETLQKLYKYCISGKTAFYLPTIATNTYQVMYDCIDAVKTYWQQGGKGCLGLHIEGPWIHSSKRGAHIESLIHSPKKEEVIQLLEYGKDVIKMITLAPEVCDAAIIQLIKSYGIVVSAGHSNATYEQAINSFNNGITTVTHLYNAMSGLQHREPGMVGAAFNHREVMASIIPDGYHVDFAAIKIAKKMMDNRLFVITDAVTQTTQGHYQHTLMGDKYESNFILSGSALTMEKAVNNLVNYCGIEIEEAFRMCSLYPAMVLGLDQQLGKIEKGFQAAFTYWE
jgi:N-acetylglucosamine-6-phosphate deacetylase